ncbi:hypothetical protein J7E50_06820 [Pedobacter sp. ISL-68]|uniref:hypothetical protein n=1 Tax=unclassified Pedobacter TaxID=2628915 RepID=UPI001BEA2368|nr:MULTISPECIES: hypothetical protein [unclassified Pedobacter]MBT2564400.1 hypothetical protein [Pedobacter sp. ISL-64]MBT2589924.1 hypothetical protein [Pedobacter sp. ISL-68]
MMRYFKFGRIILPVLFLCLIRSGLFAQTFNTSANQAGIAVAPTDHFSYLGKDVSFYSLGWYNESVDWPPYAYLSSYSGIKFFTGGLPRTYIDLDGNMGVNTLSPREKLDIWGGNISVTGSDHNGTAVIGSSGGVAFFSNNSYTNGLAVAPNGNVGIGTTDANEKFVVNGNLKIILDQGNFPSKNVVSMVALGYSGNTGAKNWALRSVYQYGNGVGNNADGGDLDVIKSLDGSLILATKTDGTAMGNIGIGTTNPSERLSVNGKIKANEIRVDGNGQPDYVFEEGYKISSLKETEQYIKLNKHLPEVPSAAEAAENGIALGEMNKLLLKKIEELTLHLIEKDKQYGELLNDVKKQELRLRLLEKKLDK